MKYFFLLCAMVIFGNFSVFAQMDTIFTLEKKIVGTVTELGLWELKYTTSNNSKMQIVLAKNTINKIHFANGEKLVLDSTIYKYTYSEICKLQYPLLTHHASETDSMIYIGEFVCGVPDNYYYNSIKRPDSSMHGNILAIGRYYSADVIYLPENAFAEQSTTVKTGTYNYGVKAKFYTKKMQNFAYISAMIVNNKKYACTVIRRTQKYIWFENANYLTERKTETKIDTIKSEIIFNKVIEKNNRCYISAFVDDFIALEREPMEVIYCDVQTMVMEYNTSEKKQYTIVFNFLQEAYLPKGKHKNKK
jgi:hypothetical protein